ncbi:unnamed protein product [Rotaria sp. Silwood2]|nr:unnamed protein product [Rotaria sp. Silwood2]CAF3091240.1 unnamed protein product [Rotaria sp. Silwood2]CAF3409161.1 unnamed protein product [Rotaria sp. Silwood2]CAF4373966.1 unnamed protein product [Rotaria sp. Silwood2]CAF4444001.1 unnamed protein product [Rotaria sp. Silwood2]
MATNDANSDALGHTQQIGTIIRSNQAIRRHVQLSVNDFLDVRKTLLEELKTHGLDEIDQFKPLAETMNIQTLNKKVTSEKVQLALCGENSSGKTSFLHRLLQIGDILPSGVGPVTARIIRLMYADPKHSCICIFKSLEDSLQGSKSKIVQKIDLSPFFTGGDQTQSNELGSLDNTNWDGIMYVLEEHIKRPVEKDISSSDFADWARHFVEIRLPSPTLKWNIDVYDTPGFLFDDAPVLKEILSNLVHHVHPTLVFLYDNASTTDEMNNCYLAMKSALKQFDSSSIFYLNTKVDIDHMPNITQSTTLEQFKKILAEQRSTRYDLLKKAPCLGNDNLIGLPESIDDCDCFDICSVLSNADELGAYMNTCAIYRLIQFVANSDLVVAKRVTSLVLPAIEAFFDLTLIISHRTSDQLQQLRRDALSWHQTYFSEHRKHFDAFLTKVYDIIQTQLELTRHKLIMEAAKLKNKNSIELYLCTAVKHVVVKKAVSDTVSEMVNTIIKMFLSNRNLMVNASSNELLVAALRTEDSEVLATVIKESLTKATFQYYMLNSITTPTMLVAEILFSDDDTESSNETVKGLLKQLQHTRYQSQQRTSNSFDIIDNKLEAQQCLDGIASQMRDEKTALGLIIGLWSDAQKEKLVKKINELYKGAEKLLPLRNKAHGLIKKYASSFARIYCHLQAAQDLAKFDGMEPRIETDDSQSTTYSIHKAKWENKQLLVKRLRQPEVNEPNTAYFEGSYHLKVKSLNIPYIVDISYLYVKELPDKTRDLWMLFPLIERNLVDFMQQAHKKMALDTVLEMMTRISTALECLHKNELVHRNVTASNIVFDDNNRIHLIDLGDWYTDKSHDLTIRHDPLGTPNGTNDDIRDLGHLGLELLPLIECSNEEQHQQERLNNFQEAALRWSKASSNEPISAESIKVELKSI